MVDVSVRSLLASTGSSSRVDYGVPKCQKKLPKNTKIVSRELEVIKKCQERMKIREMEELEKRANAAKLDEENMRLEREEEAERARVTAQVIAYRHMM